MKKLIHLSVIFSLWLVACIDPPTYPIEPEIKFVEMIGDTIGSNEQDSISVQFTFTDGDGNLGYTLEEITDNIDSTCLNICDSLCYNTDYTSIIALDSRTFCSIGFNLPLIPNKGSSKSITGLITLDFHNWICFNEDQTEQIFTGVDSFQMYIKVKDRDGNISNEIVTPMIYIKCSL